MSKKVSIIIPARNEPFLQRTVQDVIEKAQGNFEIIVVLDGYWPVPQLENNKNLIVIHRGRAHGMRAAINSAASIASGKYLLKSDAHCMFDEGFDIKLIEDCEDNWVVIPRRKRLDAEKWCIRDVGKPDVDYESVTNPYTDDMHGTIWTKRAISRKDVLIDDNPTFQGSCWFMKKDYFSALELMDAVTYGSFYNEAQEISFKAWMSGGRVMINKKTWYAHLHKGNKHGRGYCLARDQRPIARDATLKWASNDGWNKQTVDFSAFVEHFSCMPGWSDEDVTKLKKKDRFNKKICSLNL